MINRNATARRSAAFKRAGTSITEIAPISRLAAPFALGLWAVAGPAHAIPDGCTRSTANGVTTATCQGNQVAGIYAGLDFVVGDRLVVQNLTSVISTANTAIFYSTTASQVSTSVIQVTADVRAHGIDTVNAGSHGILATAPVKAGTTSGSTYTVGITGRIDTYGSDSHGIFIEPNGANGSKGADEIFEGGKSGGNGGGGPFVNVLGLSGGTPGITTRATSSNGVLTSFKGGNGGGGGYGGLGNGGGGGRGGDGPQFVAETGYVGFVGDWNLTTLGDASPGFKVSSVAGNGGNGGTGDIDTGGGGGAGGATSFNSLQIGTFDMGAWTIVTRGANSEAVGIDLRGGNGGGGGTGSVFGGGAGAAGKGAPVLLWAPAFRGGAPARTLNLTTQGADSPGIIVQVTSGNGGKGGNADAATGKNGAAGGAGAPIQLGSSPQNVANGGAPLTATITTSGEQSFGVFLKSVGGKGGTGGDGNIATNGGAGGVGGVGGAVSVYGGYKIGTQGAGAHGIAVYSLGGEGGTGGKGGPLGGSGGAGGTTGANGVLTLDFTGTIDTAGPEAHGVIAQNIAGHGGNAGTCVGFVCFAASGSSGGAGGAVNVTSGAAITTRADQSAALIAQSIGGGGGNGGDSFALFYGKGGTGSIGGAGGQVTVANTGAVTTHGNDATGLYVQSIGGAGGDGGSGGALIALGGGGSSASNGGAVTVTNSGAINAGDRSLSSTGETTAGDDPTCGVGCSHGIVAQSIGGGGGHGGSTGGVISVGGDSGGGGDGGTTKVVNTGSVTTHRDQSIGILAQSIGGGGGVGGSAGAVGIGGSVAVGGTGGAGGAGGVVEVDSTLGSIRTFGAGSFGISAQSIGGGGGHGGFGASLTLGVEGGAAFALGGSGGTGGAASAVTVTTFDPSYSQPAGTIGTDGESAHGIHAQSIGGGGGAGGAAVAVEAGVTVAAIAFSVGGSGAKGGAGGVVNLTNDKAITTTGDDANGIYAQSVGGGGGDGGFSVSGQLSVEEGGGIAASQGGGGGAGGVGATVAVFNTGFVTTSGDAAHAVIAQSMGGGGGDGGLAISGAIQVDGGASVSLAKGGRGGAGQHGAKVTVNNGTADIRPTITTTGVGAAGVFAQSIGGGGGSGGMSLSGTLTGEGGLAASVSHGGAGASGGDGGDVDLSNVANIRTGTPGDGGDLDDVSANAHGLFAQSVGGGGGSGGFSGSIAVGADSQQTSLNVAVALGGAGAGGGNGGNVAVNNSQAFEGLSLTTYADQSHGVFAQSVGGGGGDGGSSFAGTIEVLSENTSTYQVDVSVGGTAGAGGRGGNVAFFGLGPITRTYGDASHGLFLSSVGGGGGTGGSAKSFLYNMKCTLVGTKTDCPDGEGENKSYSVTVDVGGKGGAGGSGGTVQVNHDYNIYTYGDGSAAIMAYSVGGGGGDGGNASSLELKSYQDVAKSRSDRAGFASTVNIFVGGRGKSAGNGGYVEVLQSNGLLTTAGLNSPGIYAQSVGGGGGRGGAGVAGATGKVSIGGDAGAGGNGGPVYVQSTSTNIVTGVPPTLTDDPDDGPQLPDASYGIFAQSIGGGGGVGGNMTLCGACSTAPGIPSNTEIGIAQGWNGGGGAGGHGGNVTVSVTGDITTWGESAAGIFAQSVGGGGGTAGNVGFLDLLQLTSLAGSTGLNGDGGKVAVNFNGVLRTNAGGAAGIFAQSAGGTGGQQGDGGSTVTVDVTGSVAVSGEDASAILAQSVYAVPDGDDLHEFGSDKITVTINAGATVQGGHPGSDPASAVQAGAGVELLGGIDNLITNHGAISSLGGPAVVQSGEVFLGSDPMTQEFSTEPVALTIDNYGVITGDVLGDAVTVNNHATGVMNSGALMRLGAGGSLRNDGRVSVGGDRNIAGTAIEGRFTQTETGVLSFDLEHGGGLLEAGRADRLLLKGDAVLAGEIDVNIRDAGVAGLGRRSVTLIENEGALDMAALTVQPSAVAQFALEEGSVVLSYDIDFQNAPVMAELNGNNAAIASHLADLHGSALVGDEFLHLLEAGDAAAYGDALEGFSPAPYGVNGSATVMSSMLFGDSLMSCGQREGEFRFIREGDCLRLDATGRRYSRDGESGDAGYDINWGGLSFGAQTEVAEDWHAGFGLAYERMSGSSDDNLWDSDGELFMLGAVVKHPIGATLLAASLSGGYGDYDVDRMTAPGLKASGDQDIWFLGGQLRATHLIERESWFIKPSLDLSATYFSADDVTEKGAGAANLLVDGEDDIQVALRPAVQVGHELQDSAGFIFRPRVTVGLTQYLTDPSQDVTARFLGAGGTGSDFTVESGMDRTAVDLGIGVDIFSLGGTQISAEARTQFSENATSLGGGLRVTIPF